MIALSYIYVKYIPEMFSPKYSLEGHTEAETPILWPSDAKN